MIDVYIGSYEKVSYRKTYIKEKEIMLPCKVIGYLFKSRKYEVITEDGRNKKVDKIYVDY